MQRRPLLTLLVFIITLILAGCAAPPPIPGTAAGISQPPPAPQAEILPPAPYLDSYWIAGHWKWNGNRHVWSRGHWEQPRAGLVYQPAHWSSHERRWIYHPARWVTLAPQPHELGAAVATLAPPASPPESSGRPDRSDDAWLPGYWRWLNGRYIWIAGHWGKARPGHFWAPGHWRKSGPNWVFAGGFWQHY